MEIIDKVYGKREISEQVLIELMDSAPVKRLKRVNQAGASQYILDKTITRYDHSVGTMILLRDYRATIEEQIAGLLHDVAHTAFSHVVDFVFPNENHDFHEAFSERILRSSEIPNILSRHGYELDRVMDENNFPLLEQKLPDLCADRLDYTFRDMICYVGTKKAKEHVQVMLMHLSIHDHEYIFDNFSSAKQFCYDFMFMNRWVWARPLEVAAYQILGNAIRKAYDKGIITMDHLFGTDDELMAILKNCGDQEIVSIIAMLTPRFRIVLDSEEFDFIAKTKARYVDPKYRDRDTIRRLSDTPGLKAEIKAHIDHVSKGYPIRIIKG